LTERAKDVIGGTKELQIEIKRLHRVYTNHTKAIGSVLDRVITLYKEDISKANKQIEVLMNEMEENKTKKKMMSSPALGPGPLTQEMIDDFMNTEGYVLIDKYWQSIEKGNNMMAGTMKGNFVIKIRKWFSVVDNDPKALAERLWRIYLNYNVSQDNGFEKRGATSTGTPQLEAKSSQQSSYKEKGENDQSEENNDTDMSKEEEK